MESRLDMAHSRQGTRILVALGVLAGVTLFAGPLASPAWAQAAPDYAAVAADLFMQSVATEDGALGWRQLCPALQQTLSGLRTGLLLAALMIPLLLSANFQSFRLAVAIVLTIPAVVCGVLLMLLATGMSPVYPCHVPAREMRTRAASTWRPATRFSGGTTISRVSTLKASW